MANVNIKVDDKVFKDKSNKLIGLMSDVASKAIGHVADEVLRLSQFEVPHDTGALQNSGHIENISDSNYLVGYNKVYAARLHEHPEYHFQKGRKGKYLEDPIKNNLEVFKNYIQNAVNDLLR